MKVTDVIRIILPEVSNILNIEKCIFKTKSAIRRPLMNTIEAIIAY